jgi:hypothetical protein
MARKTRRRGKRVRATRRVRRIGRVRRVRRSRGGSRRYKNEGGGPFPTFPTFDDVKKQVNNLGPELSDLGRQALTEAKILGSQVSTLGSNTLSRFTRPSAQTY